MPMANVNRIVFVNLHSASQFVTTRQSIVDWHIFFHNTYKFRTFLLAWVIADSHRLTDSAVLFRKPITRREHPLELDDGLCSTWAAVN